MKKLFSDLGRIWKMLVKDIIHLSWFLRGKGRVHLKRPFFCTYGERCATNACMLLLKTPHLVQYLFFCSFLVTKLVPIYLARQRSQLQLSEIAPFGEGLKRETCQDMRPNRVNFSSPWLGMKHISDYRKEMSFTDSFSVVPLLYMNE